MKSAQKLGHRMDNFAMVRAQYEYWNASAMRRVEPGGLMFTCCGSPFMKRDTFIDTIKESAHRAKRHIKLVKVVHAGSDHTVSPAFAKGEHLKCLLIEVR